MQQRRSEGKKILQSELHCHYITLHELYPPVWHFGSTVSLISWPWWNPH